MIRALHPVTDLAAVAAFLAEAADYWIMAEGTAPASTASLGFAVSSFMSLILSRAAHQAKGCNHPSSAN